MDCFLCCIYFVVQRAAIGIGQACFLEVVRRAKNASVKYYSFTFDAGADSKRLEHMLIELRFLEDNRVVSAFVKACELRYYTATKEAVVIFKALKELNLPGKYFALHLGITFIV